MSIIRIIDQSISKEDYNRVAVHPLQSWEWGETRIAEGKTVLRFGEWSGEKLTAVHQMTIHPIPHTPYVIGYIPRGPVLTSEFITWLMHETQSYRLIFIKCEPNISYSESKRHALTVLPHVVVSKHPLFPEWTQVLDLTPSESDLLACMKPKTRYNIRLAQKKGVTVREENTDEGFSIFFSLYFSTCKRQGYHGHTPKYHRNIWNHLGQNIAHILTAYYQDKPLASYELFQFHDVLYYPYGGSADSDRNVMAPNLLMWEAIRFGKLHGARLFDMWGSLPPDIQSNTNSWAGFTRFKEGYGTQYIRMIGSYDIVINPLLYHLYSAAHVLRTALL